MHPHPCLKNSLGTDAGSPATIPDMFYTIEIVPTSEQMTFAKFYSTVNDAHADLT